MGNRSKPVVTTFTDEYGDERTIYRERGNRLKIARIGNTPSLALTAAIGKMVGRNIKAERIRKGWSLLTLAERAGVVPATKHRMYEIENAMSSGIRLGTLYTIAVALEIPVSSLLPDAEEALREAGVSVDAQPRLGVVS